MSLILPAMSRERSAPGYVVNVVCGPELGDRLPIWREFVLRDSATPLSMRPDWLKVVQQGLRHIPFGIEVVADGRLLGFLPLALIKSWLFGRFLVSMPFLNYGGPIADSDLAEQLLLDRAAQLADEQRVRFLEVRATKDFSHFALPNRLSTKMHMRLALPSKGEVLWKQLDAKVRNQIRKGQKGEFSVAWGGVELLPDFYQVFARNMRDLGTPVYGRPLFRAILETFPDAAEFCVVHLRRQVVASALLLHGREITEVPCASSLREFNSTNANMLMYWHLLQRGIERRQSVFDFGRSTVDSNTYRFKKQWGATPTPAVWQYYLRTGDLGQMRPENRRFDLMKRAWQRLPLSMAGLLGPKIVRGIP